MRTILNLPQGVLEQFFLIAGQQDVAPEKLADKLVQMSEAHKVLVREWLNPSVAAQPDLEALIKEAWEAAQAGRQDDAQVLLTKASVTAETEAQNAPAMSAKNGSVFVPDMWSGSCADLRDQQAADRAPGNQGRHLAWYARGLPWRPR